MIKAGAMREQITLERLVETVQLSGAVAKAWVLERSIRAELVQQDAQAFLGGTDRTEMRNVFRIWAADWISTDMRLIHKGQTYRISRIVVPGQLGMELHCVNAVDEVQP